MTQQQDERDDAPPRRRADGKLFELVMGGGVLLISLVSLFIAVSANRTQERMLAASVWPSLLVGTSNAGLDGTPQITFDVLNRGIGPARVRWAEVLYDDTPVRDSKSLLEACCGPLTDEADRKVFTSGIQHRVLGADEWITLLRLPRAQPVPAYYTALEQSLPRMRFRACYCSVLDDCWLLDSRNDEPDPVRECPAPPKVLWGRR